MVEKEAPFYKVAGVILLYWCTSWTAIFMNKFVYTNLKKSFDAPYFVTFIQFVAPTFALYLFSKFNKYSKIAKSFPDIKFSWHLALRVFPLSILYCLMVTMSNLCLKYVEVSFYQISRSLGIPMIPLINYLLFGETTTLRTVLSCITVVVGYIAGVDGEVNFSLKGTLFGLGASAVGTFYTIYLKRYLSNVVNNSWLLTFYTNFNSCIILPFLCLINGEIPVIWSHRSELTLHYYMWICVSGIIGLFVGITTYLQIQYTSSLSHNISGVMKNCIQTFMGAYFYGTHITAKGLAGILLVVGGSFSYAMERIQSNKNAENDQDKKALLEKQPIQSNNAIVEVTEDEQLL